VTPEPSQRFSIGYHLNSWDLGGLELEPGLEFLAAEGFGSFEALARDGYSNDFARRFMRAGHAGPPERGGDIAFWERIALFSRVQRRLGLRVASLYVNAELTNPQTWPGERDTLESIGRLLAGFGASVLVMGGGPPALPGRAHDADEVRVFCAALAEAGKALGELGIRLAYHPHMDTFVETGDQLAVVMDHLDTDAVGLCIDPAHLQVLGSDPVLAVRDYGEHLAYMHLKDSLTAPEGATPPERYASFRALGAGDVDFPGLVDALIDIGYDGLAIVELDVSEDAEASCRESVAYLRRLGLELTPA
jgi:inosose dehydratase